MLNWFTKWLISSLLSTAVIIGINVKKQHQVLNDDFYQLIGHINVVLAQHDALIPLLNAGNVFERMQKKFPQLIAIDTFPTSLMTNETITPTTSGRYWLNNHYRQIRLLIDTSKFIHSQPQLKDFSNVTLRWNKETLSSFSSDLANNKKAIWVWKKQIGTNSQPFVLEASGTVNWRLFSWNLIILSCVVWAGVLFVLQQFMAQSRRRKVADLRAHYYELTRLDTVNEVTTGMIHEMNQPLTAIMSYNQSALRLLDQHSYHQLPTLLNAAVMQIKRIAEMLENYRNNLTAQQMLLKPIAISCVWKRVEQLLENEISAGNIHIINKLTKKLPLIMANSLWLEQIFHNLLNNAIQAQQNEINGWVKIEATLEKEMLKIMLSDGGKGLSDEGLKQVFMPFYTTRQEGMGLGMTLAETLVQRLHGNIEVSNLDNGGACFTLRLPIISSKDQPHEKKHLSN